MDMDGHTELTANPHGQSAAARTAGRIRAHMAERNDGPAQLAEALEISRPTARRWMAGRHNFTLNEIDAIAEWLDLDPFELWSPTKKGALT